MAILEVALWIIGGISSLYGVYSLIREFRKWKSKRDAERNDKKNEFGILKEWTAYYKEDDGQQVEDINLSSNGGKNISAVIKKDKKQYKFTGVYDNYILSGNYIDKKQGKREERGTLALTYVNDGLVYGFCTLVNENRDIYNTPYALTPKAGLSDNTYSFCKGCYQKQSCCCNHADIDLPILLPNEVEAIALIQNVDKSLFAEQRGKLWQMKRVNGACYFFRNSECSIYKQRPIDCRLFPFDIRKDKNGKNWLVLYQKQDICKYIPTDSTEIKNYESKNKKLIKLIKPYLDDWTNEMYMERLKDQKRNLLNTVEEILKED